MSKNNKESGSFRFIVKTHDSEESVVVVFKNESDNTYSFVNLTKERINSSKFVTVDYSAMQPCDYARIDFMLEEESLTPYFLEVNVLMNLGIQGGFVNSFLNSHFKSYEELINHILKLGLAKLDISTSASKP